ncbi:MAG: DUF4188 domain-containing protein [Caldilineales bacterium]
MADIYNGRYTADIEGDFVVFNIGMRINRLRAVRKWMPVSRAMGPMMEALYRRPDLGFLGGQSFVYWRGVALVQYWRSFEHLERFARDPQLTHLSAWKAFNKAVAGDGSVGIWHETYLVHAGEYESVYGNMPRFGLAAAADHLPAVGVRATARLRLRQQGAPNPVANINSLDPESYPVGATS